MESRGFRLAEYERLRMKIDLHEKELRSFVKAVDGMSVGDEGSVLIQAVQARNLLKVLNAYRDFVEYVDSVVKVESSDV